MLNNDMASKTATVTYETSGVSYDAMDPFKRLAQRAAKKTGKNFKQFEIREVQESRGESSYVWEEQDCYKAFVIEGLGTKNLVADQVRRITGKTYYEEIAQDAVGAIVNDIVVVGASPQVINAYFAVGDSNWFSDKKRSRDLASGWANACDLAGAVWGGGETPTLKNIVLPGTIEIAGSCIGVIKPKERLTLGNRLKAGDAILLIESSGIHANGLTLARAIAGQRPKGFATKLSDGTMYGETLLTPTHIYVKYVQDLFKKGIDIHYMVNITGHGWRKLMRASKNFTYMISEIPPAQPVFEFIQRYSKNSDSEMYGNFNMGAGFAVYLPQDQVVKAQRIAQKHKLKSWSAGFIERGPKQVIIKPKSIVFKEKTLGIR